jgi:hypothetical protein
MSDDRFLTLEEVGTLLGGSLKPFPRRRITWLIDNNYLRDNGMRGKSRRVPRTSAQSLMKQIEEGNIPWRKSEVQRSKAKKKISKGITKDTAMAAGRSTHGKAAKENTELWSLLVTAE